MEWGLNALQVVVDERLKDQEISLPAMTLNFYVGSSTKVAISENIYFLGGFLCFGYANAKVREVDRHVDHACSFMDCFYVT